MLTDSVALTQQLVQIPSVSGTDGEQRILALLEEILRRAGFVVFVDSAAKL